MTPNDIDVLIHYHTSRAPHPRADAPAVSDSIECFIGNGVFHCVDGEGMKDYITTTDKGKALMKMLCDVEFPRQAWVDTKGKVINILTGE